jgi:putative heme iron utilization protein
MAETATAPEDHVLSDHDVRENILPPPPPPLVPAPRAQRRSPAEESRTLLASTNVAALGTLSDDGVPWASLVAFACLSDGAAALMVSTLAEHGRNLERDGRASLMIAHPTRELDQLAHGRVTIAGVADAVDGERRQEARDAYLKSIPAANAYERFGDFRIWVLRPERVRWVGGYGRMDDVSVSDLAGAEPDPTAVAAARAVSHLNDDHADALLDMARSLAGYPDALAARCESIDRYGLQLAIETPRGHAPARVGFTEPVDRPDGLRAATVELAKLARA